MRQLTPSSYTKLVAEIGVLYEGARRALGEAYWQIGKRIVKVEQKGEIKAAYGSGLLVQLSKDLTQKYGRGFCYTNLKEMRRVYLSSPNRRPSGDLNISQHVELLKIEDAGKRKTLERQAIRKALTRDEVRTLVRHELVREGVSEQLSALRNTPDARPDTPPELLTPQRGTLFTYRILDPTASERTSKSSRAVVDASAATKIVQPKEPGLLLIDLGFACYRDLDAVTSKVFKPLEIVESVKVADDDYKLQKSDKTESELFTYQATVEKVVDGDTLRVVVDLGFNTRTRQYLRLRGLDCPELDTPEGKLAADFVKARIRSADQIILTSSKSDKYDRYLADIFYTAKDGKEQSLNNQILAAGLAVRMGD